MAEGIAPNVQSTCPRQKILVPARGESHSYSTAGASKLLNDFIGTINGRDRPLLIPTTINNAKENVHEGFVYKSYRPSWQS